MQGTRVLLLEPKNYLQSFITDILKTQDCHCQSFSDLDPITTGYNLDLEDFSVFILNLDFFDKLFPKFIISDKPVIPLPPTLGLTNKITEYKTIEAINRGLDDCITYPFNKEVFLAKIKSLARRPRAIKTPQYRIGDFEVVRDSKELVYRSRKVDLSKKEFMLLTLLLENPNRIISKEEMIKRVWISGKAPGTNTIDVHMCNIRKKLFNDINRKIQTVHGLGYKIRI